MTQPGKNSRSALITSLKLTGRLLLSHGKTRAALAIGLLIGGAIMEGLSLLLLAPLLFLAQSQGESFALVLPLPWQTGESLHFQFGLGEALACLCLLIITQGLFGRARSIVLSQLLGASVNKVRGSLFEAIGQSQWQFVSQHRTSDLTHLLTADIDRIQLAAFSFLNLLQALIAIAVYTLVSALLSWEMTAFAAVCGIAILILMQPVRQLAARYGVLLTDRRKQQHRIVSEFLAGMKVAKSFNAERRYINDLTQALEASQSDLTRFVRASSTGSLLMQVANVIVLAVFVFAAVVWFGLPVTALVVLILVYMRMSPRFTSIQASVQELLVNAPALRAVEEMRTACQRHIDPQSNATPPAFRQEIRLESVSYRHCDGRGGVDGVSLTIPARSITALIGESGAGKSTLADLIMGLIAPQAGVILVDGEPLDDSNRSAWRNTVAYVPQETFLLNDTIEANLRIAKPAASHTELCDALRAANALRLVEGLPEGILTVVGERGNRLSGGERQRIALARAILRRPVLLVLDEATNALDADNRSMILQSIRSLRQDMAVLMIAHDSAVLDIADEIITLSSGRLVDGKSLQSPAETRSGRILLQGSAR